jgi:alpha-mannosidase
MTSASQENRHLLDRFLAEVTFVEGLFDLHPAEAPAWRKLLAKAAERVRLAIASGGTALSKAICDAEDLLAPIARVAKTYTVYCVGHGHLDMNWMWSWPETVAATNDMFRTVLRLMEEYPDFHFSQSQAAMYEIVQKHNPAMLDEIRARVKEGRWEVTASHWVEGEKNVVVGESLCRHLLETRRFMQELFGLSPEDVQIDWSPDTFGHAATIPSYLVRGGVKRYYLCRTGNMPTPPMAFWWEAPDGSRVVVCRETTWYNGVFSPGEIVPALLGFCKGTGLRFWMYVYGVGDHGGGPTRRDLERAAEMVTWPVFPTLTLCPSSRFYDALEKAGDRLPVVKGELNFELTGCYTSQTLIKRSVRLAESQLCDAETSAALAWASAGLPYPAATLRENWRRSLFNHFHDILPGSCVHDSRTYTHGLFQEIVAAAGIAETNALRGIAAKVDTSHAAEELKPVPSSFMRSSLGAGIGYGAGEGRASSAEQSAGQGPRPFVIFNTLAHERAGVATVQVWDSPPPGETRKLQDYAFSVVLPSGKTVAAQRVATGTFWFHDFVTLAFPVEPLPGFGYATYVIKEEKTAAGTPIASGDCVMENERVRVKIDTLTGQISSLTDKASGVDVIDPARQAGVLEVATERPHEASAWSIDKTLRMERMEVVSTRVTQNGPHLARLDVACRIRESSFTVQYELRADDPCLYISLDGTWLERGTAQAGVPNLSIAFPLALKDAAASYEIPFGGIDRKQNAGEEVPAIRWAAVTGLSGKKRAGCVLLNDCKHGHSLDGDTLRLRLIRSTYEPDPLPELGRHRVRLGLVPFAGSLSTADAIRLGADFNQPLRPTGTDVHKGVLPSAGAFLSLAPANIAFSALKKTEDGNELLIRVFETEGKTTVARIGVDAKLLGTLAGAVEVDVLERPVAGSRLKIKGNGVSVPVPAHGLATVRLQVQW